MTYLADTSTIVRLRRGRDIAPRWLDVITAGLVGICPVVEAELTRAVASKDDHERLHGQLKTLFTWHPMPDASWRLVEQTQHELVNRGLQKGPSVVDLLVAATAQAWGLTVLHVDANFDTIARVVSLRTRRANPKLRESYVPFEIGLDDRQSDREQHLEQQAGRLDQRSSLGPPVGRRASSVRRCRS